LTLSTAHAAAGVKSQGQQTAERCADFVERAIVQTVDPLAAQVKTLKDQLQVMSDRLLN